MKSFLRARHNGGFTLIELMIVVAIVSILALLAIFGVSKFMAAAKTAEATSTIGQINSLAMQAYNRENGNAQLLLKGGSSGLAHSLCGRSSPVPESPAAVMNRKYVPNPNGDYQALKPSRNDNQNGWRCLKHEMTEGQYYQYAYTGSAGEPSEVSPQLGTPAGLPQGANWFAEAEGDLDGDGLKSRFVTGGGISRQGTAVPFTQIVIENAEE